MKKILTLIALALIAVVALTPLQADSVIKVNAKAGTVSVYYQASDYTDLKVLIQKGDAKYVYNLYDADEVFPLQMGDGTYTIGLYQRTTGNKYRKLSSVTQAVDIDEMTVYQASVQNINWDDYSQSTALAQQLTTNAANEQAVFDALYAYMVQRIAYDYDKATVLKNASRYIPSNDVTIQLEKGICYDYSSLFASMLRSQNIPTRLVEGTSTYTSEYHAWNEVFLNGKWVIVDTTVDALYERHQADYSYIKSAADYAQVKNY